MSHDNESGGIHLGSLLIGVSLGVAATLLYATYREKSFNRIVSRTKELSDDTGEFFSDLSKNVRDRVSTLSGRVQEVAEDVEDSAKDAVRAVKRAGSEVAERAKSVHN